MNDEQDFDDPWLEAHLQRLAGDAPSGPATRGAGARVARRARRLRLVRHLQHLAVAGLAAVAAVVTAVAVLPDGGGRIEMTADQGGPGIGTTDSRPTASTTTPATVGTPATTSGTGAAVTPSPSLVEAAATTTGPGDPGPPAANEADPGEGSGGGAPGTGAPTSTAPTATAAPTPSPTAAAPTTTAPTNTAPNTRTYAMAGGTVVIRWTASTLTLVSASPNPGFTEAREVQPTEIEISFTSSTASSKVHLHLSGGQLVEENEEG